MEKVAVRCRGNLSVHTVVRIGIPRMVVPA